MPFGLPARDEANWDTKLNDSINAVKATADAAQVAADLDAGVTAVDANAASALRIQQDARLSATYAARGPAPSGVDDTAALVAALSASDEVILDEGTYLVTPPLAVPTGARLRGKGPNTIIAPIGTAVTTTVTLGADAEIADLTVNGGTGPTYVVSTSDRSRVTRCTIKNGATYGIQCVAKADVRIVDNLFIDIPNYAVLAENAVTRFVFQGNTVSNASSGKGITIKVNAGNPVDTRVVGNTVDVQGVIGLEVQGSGATRGVIADNVVRNADIGISLSSSNGMAISGNTCADNSTYGIEAAQVTTDSTIVGNTILRPGTGIVISSPSASPASKGVTVSGNTISAATIYGIQVEYGSGHIISNNNIEDPANRAIFLNNSPARCVVSGNRIGRVTAPASSSAADGIYITGSDHLVSSNLLDYSTLATQNGYGVYANSASRVQIVGNRVYGSKKGYAIVGGTGHHLAGNAAYATTEHALYTSGVTILLLDGFWHAITAGAAVDTSGVTTPFIGNVFNLNGGGSMTNGSSRFSATTVGFYGVTPVTRPTAPTAADASAVNSGDAATDTVINNMRTRIGELETKLRALGLIT